MGTFVCFKYESDVISKWLREIDNVNNPPSRIIGLAFQFNLETDNCGRVKTGGHPGVKQIYVPSPIEVVSLEFKYDCVDVAPAENQPELELMPVPFPSSGGDHGGKYEFAFYKSLVLDKLPPSNSETEIHETEVPGFAYFSKNDLQGLAQASEFVYLSGSLINVADFALPKNKLKNRLFFTYKIEGDMEKKLVNEADSASSIPAYHSTLNRKENEAAGLPGISQGTPCPPHWFFTESYTNAGVEQTLEYFPVYYHKIAKWTPPVLHPALQALSRTFVGKEKLEQRRLKLMLEQRNAWNQMAQSIKTEVNETQPPYDGTLCQE